ncbi:hypothetical protein BABINDRAFT_30089 [Babjeviella inositovora NRRL Y-12698]|uniref:Endoplasmic reticulum transmembrane protein n=1 Tax=Babjeviella inositovora NRRL Y-12698 TaxID=984486 RepID=A0A1E3QZF3_9ASCO|nr:uncharacterized protein BABINDRAFT_30089 [Babjeviella inositovora NRRL Y-12698]ODQ82924.1 hypothetical protein BABINDRAFT_30089 [Babjeviella inositovora NRRL Y-12698]
MALYYNIVFSILVTEMAMFGLLSLPLPRNIRGTLLSVLSKPFQSAQFQIAIKCILAFILILFVDSVNRVYKVSAELQAPTNHPEAAMQGFIDRSDVQARRFYAQRNMYLCGFTLFLTLILTRTYALVDELVVVKTKLAALGSSNAATSVAAEADASQEIVDLKSKIQAKEAERENLTDKAASLSSDYKAVAGDATARK